MLVRRFLQLVLVSVACVASGTLECGHRDLTESQRHGAEVYVRMCAVCHGRNGEGYAADEAPAIANPGFLTSATDEQIRRAVAFGRPGTTMSAWASARSGPLSPSDVSAVVAFVRSWNTEPRAVLDERPRTGDATRGAMTFAKECVPCHGVSGAGGPEVHIGSPTFLADASDGYLRYAIANGRRGAKMPAFRDKLGGAAIEDLVSVLRLWQSNARPAPMAPPAPRPPLPLGPVPLNPHGPEPVGFRAWPKTMPADAIKKELDRGARMALLDARASSDYLNEHIAGAVSVPFFDPAPYLAQLPKDAWLVCYCACPHAESGQLAQKLVDAGFTKVTVLDEGLGVWRARKYPTTKGEEP